MAESSKERIDEIDNQISELEDERNKIQEEISNKDAKDYHGKFFLEEIKDSPVKFYKYIEKIEEADESPYELSVLSIEYDTESEEFVAINMDWQSAHEIDEEHKEISKEEFDRNFNQAINEFSKLKDGGQNGTA